MSPSLTIRPALPDDIAEISKLHARVFGPGRFARSAYRVREGKGHLSRFCLVACLGKTVIASIRTTEIAIGGKTGAVLLGPIAVDNEHRSLGLGSKLIAAALEAARNGGARLIVLVGDHPYYGRFGFNPVPMGQIVFPGPVNPQRILAYELAADALAEYRGLVVAEPLLENPPDWTKAVCDRNALVTESPEDSARASSHELYQASKRARGRPTQAASATVPSMQATEWESRR